MKNIKLLSTKDQFNDFTLEIQKRYLQTGNSVKVKMRNGVFVHVIFVPANETGTILNHFSSDDFGYAWEPDGSSVKNWVFDLIEIED